MKIIALEGKGKTGKTTTIKMLCDIIQFNNHNIVCSLPRRTVEKAIIYDINGKYVAVITKGDKVDDIKREIDKLAIKSEEYGMSFYKDISLLICACHKGQSTVYLMGLSNDVTFISNPFVADVKTDNKKSNVNQVDIDKIHKHFATALYDLI